MRITWLTLIALVAFAGFGLAGCGCGDDDDDNGGGDDDLTDDDVDDDTDDDSADDDVDDDTGDDDTPDDDTSDDDTADDDTADDDTADDDTADDDTTDDDTADDDTADDDTGDDDTVADDCTVPLEDPIDVGSHTATLYEYGDETDPDARTTPVGAYFWFADPYVTFVRGISMSAVPLHGLGHIPDGAGPFPLVLIVHGNHSASELSYPGYQYLTEHLATHGMIAISVEEDFLNGGVSGEMDARGIVLLRHLHLFREWNADSGHPLFGKIDMNKIGLAGHSRGGEAVTVAWQFNTTKHNAGDPLHNFNFNIRSLFAIAPVDGQIGLFNDIIPRDVDYFIMHGSHDGDVSDFQGHQCYDRALPVDEATTGEKGLLFVQGANHGQWNTVWAPAGDPSPPGDVSVPLISAQDQQDVGKIFMTAWFRWTLLGRGCYRHMAAGEVEFPSFPSSAPLMRQYQNAERVFLDHYQEDANLSTGSYAGVTNANQDFDAIAEQVMSWGNPGNFPGSTRGLVFAWDGGGKYTVTLPTITDPAVDEMDMLALRVGQVNEAADNYNTLGESRDFSVSVVVNSVESDAVKASDYRDLISQARVEMQFWGDISMSVLDTVRIPLKDFNGGSDLLPSEIESIIFEFDQDATGAMGLDEIQFTKD
ncbi:MAG: hypothetical protein KJ042_03580 [Deltaproteobacteria bacterium]|nr:hypothetical protein [Deltaproteobacteria bacterium]